MGKHLKSFCLVLLCLLGAGLIGVAIGLPIYAERKGYESVFEYIQTWPVFDNDDEKTVEDEIVDDNLTEDEETETSEDETQTDASGTESSEDQTETQGE